ncbi:Sensory transduction histidine kinase [Methanosarcina lacustris Z-7289]|uniref:Sensory transduction histidine kinase n=1 Tax=Methanosarcina lacustris Z-7289 TaxID=1434111 RepID=A0A0E3S522_9EURY|nr:PAS domain S-box protein [Methanosarcina lacustris]AKB75376.1 Sensory transduction histidine kinase [Methanosarcina lacustris Z-7289]
MEEFLLNSPSPVLRIEKEGVILYANEAGKSLLEAWGSGVGEKVPVKIRETVRKAALKKKSEYMELETGEKTYSATFIPSADGKYTILHASDVTFSKQAAKKLSLKLSLIDRYQEALSQITELALKTSDIRTLLEESLTLIAATLDVEYCKILKILPDGNFLFETGIGWKIEDIGKVIERDAASTAVYTVLSKKPIQIEELNRKGSIDGMGLKGYQEIINGISVLIGRVEKPYGVLTVHSTKKETFTKEETSFLNSIASLISLTIERNKVESTLREKIHYLETLLDTIPAPVFYTDKEGVYRGCNELFARMILGSSKEQVTRCSVDELSETIPPELGDVFRRVDRQLLQRGGSQVYESKVMCSDGIIRQFLFNKAVYRNLNGTVEGLVGVMLDITGRKLTEENLLKSEERYRLAAEQTGQLIYEFDLQNGHVEWAGAVTELTGYSYNEMQDFTYYDWLYHIPSEERRRVQKEFKKCWNTGEKFNEEFRFRRKDGSYFFVENKGVYLRDEEGCVCKALGVMKDITEIKLSSEKLKESEELYRSFLQNFKGIAFKVDRDFTPLFLEGALEEITGYTGEDFISGRINLPDIIYPEDRPLFSISRKKMRSSPNSIMEHEYRLTRKDGTVKWVHELIHNICDASGKTEFIQGYAYDITLKKKAEETLEKAEAIGMREIHHRIKNNLQVVSSLLSLQADKFKDKDVIEAFRESENRVISMSIIHEELHKSEDTTSIDFEAYLRKLTSDLLYSYRVGNEKIRLFLDIGHIFIGVDTAVPLGIIINELFSNSLKYAFSKGVEGEIRISLCRKPEALEPGSAPEKDTGIKDTGITDSGMYPGFTLVYSDNGGHFPENIDIKNPETLGLQLVNALVEQIDGTIDLEKGEETKYTIQFDDKDLPEKS